MVLTDRPNQTYEQLSLVVLREHSKYSTIESRICNRAKIHTNEATYSTRVATKSRLDTNQWSSFSGYVPVGTYHENELHSEHTEHSSVSVSVT